MIVRTVRTRCLAAWGPLGSSRSACLSAGFGVVATMGDHRGGQVELALAAKASKCARLAKHGPPTDEGGGYLAYLGGARDRDASPSPRQGHPSLPRSRNHACSPRYLRCGAVITHARVGEPRVRAPDLDPAEKDVVCRVRNTKIYACVVTRTLGGTAFRVDALYRRHARERPISAPLHHIES
jgi:hypothetical protein